MSFSSNMRFAVVRGGTSSEYENSLRSGKFILDHVPQGCQAVDVLVDRNGVWHVAGFPKSPADILHQVDVAWNVLHATGSNEAAAFRLSGTRVIGPTQVFSSLNQNVQTSSGTPRTPRTPRRLVLRKEDMTSQKIYEIFTTFPHPVKVRSNGSAVTNGIGTGIGGAMISHIVTRLPELHDALAEIFAHTSLAIIEEYISGRRASVAMINGYRGVKEYALPVVEIRGGISGASDGRDGSAEFDHRSLREDEKKELSRMTISMHRMLQSPHYSQSEYVIHPRRGIFLIDADSSPVLHEKSPFIHALGLVGARPEDFVGHVIRV